MDYHARIGAVEAGLGLTSIPASRLPRTFVCAEESHLPALPSVKVLLCAHPNRPGEAPAGAEVALVAEDVPKAFAAAIAGGAVAYVEPITKPWGQIVSYVRDLNGFLVEICSQVG